MRRSTIAGIAVVSTIALTQIASAADLPRKAPAYAPPPPPPVISWTGWYVGLNAGYHWSHHCVHTTTTTVFENPGTNGDVGAAIDTVGTGSTCPDDNGFIGGGQIGYNWQLTNWVVGLEADIQGLSHHNGEESITQSVLIPGCAANSPSECTATGTITSSRETNWLGTVRGRAGWLATPSFLIYATGGLAYGQVKASTTIRESLGFPDVPSPFGSAGSFDNTRAGWTAGAGAEWMFVPNWSVKVEYLYYDLGTETWSLGNMSAIALGPVLLTTNHSESSTRFNGNIVRAGLNFHF